MDQECKDFFHKVLEKTTPALTFDGRESVINGVLSDTFGHPWADSELQSSVISNIARQHGLEDEVPEDYRDEDLQPA